MDKAAAQHASTSDIVKLLDTSVNGLSAGQVEMRQYKYGTNTLKKDRPTGLHIFVKQFRSSLIYLLLVAAAISFALQDVSDGVAISIILLINAGLGFLQEFRSEKTIENLSKFIAKQVLVIRQKKTQLIDEHLLVPGDLILLREGDIVPADCKIIEAEQLSVDESQLTGESVPVNKNTTDASLLFTGSVIEKGEGKAIVFAIGNDTELGKIAALSQNTKRVTQYEKSLQAFSNYLMRIILVTLAMVFAAKVLITHDISHISTLFLFVIALAITVIPEALPVIAIVTLSEGALRLAKKAVVVKRLSALEDLGNVNLLCTDKTGTLTENKLHVEHAFSDDLELFQTLAYATIEDPSVNKKKFRNAYDAAFLAYVPKDIREKAKNWKQLDEVPFDPSARRRRIILEHRETHEQLLVEVGSVGTLLQIAHSPKHKALLAAVAEDGRRGIRHIGIAYKKIEYREGFNVLTHESGLEFLGYVQLIDPLRKTAKAAIELAKKLGLTIKILTGDSAEVAEFVGREVGLLEKNDKVYTGDEIEHLSKSELHTAIESCAVFAHVTPQQKYTIIQILKEHHVVGYQGDGINDAPSLKLADVAIAVNTATDVAKASADIVLLKNDLHVIVSGIHYGREIFVNINKYIKHVMIGNLGNFFSLAVLYLISFDLPLLPLQLLVANLIQDLPLISVYSDTVNNADVKRPEQYDLSSLMFIALILGLFSAIYDFIYMTAVGFSVTAATQTNLFLFFTFTQLIIILSVRNKGHMWSGKKPSAMVIWFITLFFVVSLLMPYIRPVAHIFSFTPLSLPIVGSIIGATVLYIVLLDYMKVAYYRIIRHHTF